MSSGGRFAATALFRCDIALAEDADLMRVDRVATVGAEACVRWMTLGLDAVRTCVSRPAARKTVGWGAAVAGDRTVARRVIGAAVTIRAAFNGAATGAAGACRPGVGAVGRDNIREGARVVAAVGLLSVDGLCPEVVCTGRVWLAEAF